jgi:predicted nucleic acid-binding protein
MRTYVVIAANITLAQALPVAYTDLVMAKMDAWQRERVELVVPTLWSYEIVEGVKGAVDRGYLTLHEGFLAVDAIFSLGFKTVHPTVELSKMALAWSGTLGAARTNDGQYLALAETLKAEFWTADENLAKLAHREGASWVQWIQGPVDVAGDTDGTAVPAATDLTEAAEG